MDNKVDLPMQTTVSTLRHQINKDYVISALKQAFTKRYSMLTTLQAGSRLLKLSADYERHQR